MQKPLDTLRRADDTPALHWARANLRWNGMPSPANDVRRVREAPTGAKVGAAILAMLVLAIVIFLLVFQWNWLRGPLAGLLSERLNRPVAINGDLEVHPWSWQPRATVNGMTIGNPRWAGAGNMAELPRLTVQVKLLPLLKGDVILPLVEAQSPDVRLIRTKDGKANWVLHPDQPNQALKLPPINHFIIADGKLRLDDARRKLTFVGAVSSNEEVVGSGRGIFRLDGRGLLNGTNFTARITGAPLINVNPDRPYPFDARITSGATHVTAIGTIAHPFDLGYFQARLDVGGADMADLYYLTGLAFPTTPPYELSGGFGRADGNYAYRHFHGRVGLSDLAGNAKVRSTTGRPFLNADLVSRRLRMVDLLAVVGGAPKHGVGPMSPTQRATAARLRATHRILPDARLDTSRLNVMDAKVSYRATSVEAGKVPIRALSMKVDLDHAVLNIDPLAMTLPQGQLAGLIRIDARRPVPATTIDLRLAGARLETLVGRRLAAPPIAGGLGGRARLTGAGDSVRAVASNANGTVAVVIPQGHIRQAFAELLGINATKGLFLLLTNDHSDTPIRCAVAEFKAQNGVLVAQKIVFDTGVVSSQGRGWISLKDETMNLRLEGKSKKFRLVRVMAPITLRGSLESPKVGVDISKAAGQIGIGAILGAVVSPLAAIIPFITPGGAKDANCGALLAEASSYGAPVGR